MKAFKVVEPGTGANVALDNQHPKLGDLDPGSVQRYEAAPDHIGDTAGAIPESSFAGNANASSDLLILSDVLAKGDFEQTGPVLSLDLTGRAVSASSYGQEYKLLGEHQFPACYGGIPAAAITQAMFLGGLWTIQPATPTMEWRYTGFWPLNGTSAGFTLGAAPQVINEEPPAGNLRDHLAPPRPRSRFTARTPLVIRRASGALTADDVDAPFPGVGSLWRGVSSFTVNNLGSAAIGSRVRLTSNAYPDSSDTGNGKTLTVDVVRTSTSAQIVTELRYRVAGIANLVTKTTDLSAIFTASTGGSIQVVIDTSRVSSGANLRIGIAACLITGDDYDPVNPPFTVTDNVVAANTPLDPEWTKANIESNGAASIANYFAARVLSSAFPLTPFRVPYPPRPQIGYGYQPNSPYLPWFGSGWDYLKMMLPAQGADYYWNQDGSIRYTGNRIYEGPISNPIAPPSVSVDMTRTAKYVEVINQRTQFVGGTTPGVVYSFEPGQAMSTDIQSFDVVYVQTNSTIYSGEVTYSVVGRNASNEAPQRLSQSSYEQSGGAILVRDMGSGVLQFSLYGPAFAIPNRNGPFSITDLKIVGSGITTSPEVLQIYTGAPDSIITREAGPTVDNPFIGNAGIARDAGVHLAHAYGTPNVTMSFSEPLGVRSMGWNFYNGWSSFRIDSGSYQRVGPSYVSSISSTVGEHDRDWVAAGQTVGQFDAFQDGKRCVDGDMRALEVPDAINVSLKNYVPFSEEYPSHPKTPPYSIN